MTGIHLSHLSHGQYLKLAAKLLTKILFECGCTLVTPDPASWVTGSQLKKSGFELNAAFALVTQLPCSTFHLPLFQQHRAPVSLAQMSKLALRQGRDQQTGIFPPHRLRKTCASKMGKPWGLECQLEEIKLE